MSTMAFVLGPLRKFRFVAVTMHWRTLIVTLVAKGIAVSLVGEGAVYAYNDLPGTGTAQAIVMNNEASRMNIFLM